MVYLSGMQVTMIPNGLVSPEFKFIMVIMLILIVANHSSTPNPSPPATYPVLYADEYGK